MEKRNREFQVEVRAGSGEEKSLKLVGTPIVFDSPATIGEGEYSFTEYIRSTALDGVDLSDVCLFLNHEAAGLPLARTPHTMTLTPTERGLDMEATLPDTEQGRAVYEAVKRGDLTKMSFAFTPVEEIWNEETRERSITKLGKLYEVSLVNYPAYRDTSVQARSQDEQTTTNTENMEEKTVDIINQNLENKNNQTVETVSSPEYRSAFFKKLLGKELTDLEQKAFEQVRAEHRDAFNTLSSSASVVPTSTLNEIIKPAEQANGILSQVRQFNVPANLFVPVGSPVDAAAWHVEGAPVTRGDVTTSGVTFGAFELIKVLSMSAAAQRMTISAFEAYLKNELRQSITDALAAAVVNGSGSGQPTGIMNGVTWATSGTGKNALTTSSLTPDDLLALIAILPASYANGAKFAMSTSTLFSEVYPLKDGSGHYYMFVDNTNGGQSRLFGFPVVLDDNLAAGTILFGNFKYYGLNIPQGVAVEVSRESGFTSGLIDYRALCIADGKVILPAAFTKLTISEG